MGKMCEEKDCRFSDTVLVSFVLILTGWCDLGGCGHLLLPG